MMAGLAAVTSKIKLFATPRRHPAAGHRSALWLGPRFHRGPGRFGIN